MSSLLDHPMVCSEQWEKFTEIDHEIWKTLFNRHTELLKNRATNEISRRNRKTKNL